MRLKRRFLLGLILLSALLLRLKGLNWGFPDFLEDSLSIDFLRDFWGVFSGRITFKPFRYDWSPFYYYLVFFFQYLCYLAGRITGYYSDLTAFRMEWILSPSSLYYLGRLITVTFALGSLGILYFLGRLFFKSSIALLGVFLFSLDPIFLRYSQTLQTDVPLLFFFLSSSYFIAKIYQTGELKHYAAAGIAIGLGAATKYTPIILLLPALMAHYLRLRNQQESKFPLKLVILLILPFITFALVLPYSVLDLSNFIKWVNYQLFHLKTKHFTTLSSWLFPGTGVQIWWMHILVLLSTLYFIFQEKKSKVILFLFPPLWFYLFIVKNATFFDYYLLPIFPFFYLLLANALIGLTQTTGKFFSFSQRKWYQSSLLLILTALLVLLLINLDFQYLNSRSFKSTYTLAREWLEKNVPSKTIIASEIPPPSVQNYFLLSFILRSSAFKEKLPFLVSELAKKPTYYIYKLKTNILEPKTTASFYQIDNYRLFPYLIINSQQCSRYLSQPKLFPVHSKFYLTLEEEFQEVARFSPNNSLDPEIIIYQNQHPQLDTDTPLASVHTYREVQEKYRQDLEVINSYLRQHQLPSNYF